MMCGSKCYLVDIEVDGHRKTKKIRARTPVNARKFIRKKFGDKAVIHSVLAEKRK